MPEKARTKLNERQRRFVEAYMVNPVASDAARVAGYKGSAGALGATGSALTRNPLIIRALEERGFGTTGVADRVECQQWWTEIMHDDSRDLKDRLRASELLAKSQGAFIEVHNHLTLIGKMPMEELQDMVKELVSTDGAQAALPEVWEAELDDDD